MMSGTFDSARTPSQLSPKYVAVELDRTKTPGELSPQHGISELDGWQPDQPHYRQRASELAG